MIIISSAPGRCGLIGNPTDMYGGTVISCSTQERAYCKIYPHNALIIENDDGQSQMIRTKSDLSLRDDRLDLVRAVLQGCNLDPEAHQFHLVTSTEIPMQAGLAGSTALVAAIFGALAYQVGQSLGLHAMAEAIRKIEYEIVGVICGFQDQYMAVFGGLNYIDFRDKNSHLPIDRQPLATVEPLSIHIKTNLPILLAHTGVKHHSGTTHRPVRQRWLEGDKEVRNAYARLQSLTRFSKAALLAGDWEAMAEAMNENMTIQQHLGASGEACDHLAKVARANGAIAAKLAGAGQGGTILVLTFEPERTRRALIEAGAETILVPVPSPGLTVQEV